MEVFLGRNKTRVLIDKEDFILFDIPGNYFCYAHGYMAIKKYLGVVEGKYKFLNNYLHRLIMNAPPGIQVDHINGNKLDNRKENLRLCTNAENSRNKKVREYKGIYFNKANKKWIAQISFNYKTIYIGSFINAKDALLAHNEKAKELHGEFARLNIVE